MKYHQIFHKNIILVLIIWRNFYSDSLFSNMRLHPSESCMVATKLLLLHVFYWPIINLGLTRSPFLEYYFFKSKSLLISLAYFVEIYPEGYFCFKYCKNATWNPKYWQSISGLVRVLLTFLILARTEDYFYFQWYHNSQNIFCVVDFCLKYSSINIYMAEIIY